mmetsp:Transcript_5786/g.12550  ORF Transcript_5786/g.12550 Transcript_5786/m.12550 type:complete len:96 (+) Transcript_5786:31-318(+)
MWSFPINPSNEDSTTPIATQVEPTACERLCSSQQKALVACVDSIRAARSNREDDESTNDEASSSSQAPACLSMAVSAWTKCCEEANIEEEQTTAS